MNTHTRAVHPHPTLARRVGHGISHTYWSEGLKGSTRGLIESNNLIQHIILDIREGCVDSRRKQSIIRCVVENIVNDVAQRAGLRRGETVVDVDRSDAR